jgi:hypothetical protein
VKQEVAETMKVYVNFFEKEADQEKCTWIMCPLIIYGSIKDPSEHQFDCNPEMKSGYFLMN